MQTEKQSVVREPDDLRSELAKAIEIRNAADGRAKLAAETASRAKIAKETAQGALETLKAETARADRMAIERHAKAAAEALRASSPVPAISVMPVVNTAALDRAQVQADALAAAHDELKAEADSAAAEANAAGAEARAIVDAILESEVESLAGEWIAACELSWQLGDKTTALLQLMERRSGKPHQPEWQREIRRKLDRRASAIARNPLLFEQHNWTAHLDGLAAIQEQRWQAYARRLEASQDAEFEGGES